MPRTYKVEGIVLKRVNSGEGDRIVTLFTKERGKVVAIAKGVRKLTSRRSGSLEVATQGEYFFHQSRGLDILTQAKYIASFPRARHNLIRMTQLHQILEVIDALTVENEPAAEVYHVLLTTLDALEHPRPQKHLLLANLTYIIKLLGFTHDKTFSETGLKRYIEALANRRLRSKDFLLPRPKKNSTP